MKAIDVHVHFPFVPGTQWPRWVSRASDNLGGSNNGPAQSIEAMAEYYESLDTVGVLLNVDTQTNSGIEPMPNSFISDAVARYPGRFLGLGSVDPHQVSAAVDGVKRVMLDLGLAGLKFQPITQAFAIGDPVYDPIWTACEELGAVVLIHMGTTAAGAGAPGGHGLHLKYGRPIPDLDDVAARHPELTIVAAHPGWPWHDELMAIALHKSNVYFDLSGWAPKHLPPSVVQHVNTRLQDKALFGSDFPLFSVERWMAEFDDLGLKPEVRQKVLVGNAQRVFGLGNAG